MSSTSAGRQSWFRANSLISRLSPKEDGLAALELARLEQNALWRGVAGRARGREVDVGEGGARGLAEVQAASEADDRALDDRGGLAQDVVLAGKNPLELAALDLDAVVVGRSLNAG